jgi:hypothetical protein
MVVNIIKGEQIQLRDLKIFSDYQLKKLQEYNIATADQFVGVCATPEGFNGVMQALLVSRIKLNDMLYQVKNHLPTDLAELLSKPSTFIPPLGARKPRKTRKAKKG